MAKDTLVLKNGTVIELEAGANLGALQVQSIGRAEMAATWELLTEDNLADVQIKNGAGVTVGIYRHLLLVSEMSVVGSDGAILTTYCLREKTAEERRLDALGEGQDVQNGAIDDLGAITSAIAGQMGEVRNDG